MPEQPAIRTGSHDLPVSPALDAFMTTGWEPQAAGPVEPLPVAAYTAKRRQALSARFPGERLVIGSGELKTRSNDTEYAFRAHSAFVHLTGAQEPEWVLVLEPQERGHTSTLYVREPTGRGNAAFYRDRRYGELWVGPSPTLAETEAQLGLTCRSLDELSVDAGAPTRVLREDGSATDADAELAAALSEIRLVKDEWEIAELQSAVDATVRGFEDVVRALPAARRAAGASATSRACSTSARGSRATTSATTPSPRPGQHACVLHWIAQHGPLRDGDLLLLDAGVEGDSLLHRRRHPHAADLRALHAGPAPGLRARAARRRRPAIAAVRARRPASVRCTRRRCG